MKSYISLERYNQHFYPIESDKFEELRYLSEYLSTDYRSFDESYLQQAINFYNSSFIYHDFDQQILYIGFSEWEINTNIPVPCDYAFSSYLKKVTTCKVTTDNFKNFIKIWLNLKKDSTVSYMLIYRNDKNDIECQGFASVELMTKFVTEYIKT